MHVEVLFKVGDSNPANNSPATNWQDGHPIHAMPRGLRVEPNDFNAWMVSNTAPPGFSSLPKWRRRLSQFHMIRRRAYLKSGMTDGEKLMAMRKIRTLEGQGFNWQAWARDERDANNALQINGRTDWTIADIEAEMVDEMNLRITDQQATVDKIALLGWDSNWGFADLSKHAVVHADLSWHQFENITQEPTDVTADPFRPRRKWARRAHRIAYGTLLSGQSLADVVDPALYVPCDRIVTLFLPGQLTTEDQEPT